MGKNKKPQLSAQDKQRETTAYRRYDQRNALMQNGAIALAVVVLYAVRGRQFDGLGQLMILSLCWIFTQLLLDGWALWRGEASLYGLRERFFPSLIATVALFWACRWLLA